MNLDKIKEEAREDAIDITERFAKEPNRRKKSKLIANVIMKHVINATKATRERDIEQLLKAVKDRRCPPGGVNEVSRATIEGFNRAIDYIVEDVAALNNLE